MGDGFNSEIVGGLFLLIPAIRSPNYVAGTSGWTVNQDGSAEFNNLNIRGTFTGNNLVLNSSGLFIYDSTPGAGHLILAISSAPGTDPYGNNYHRGLYAVSGIQMDPLDNSFDNSGAVEAVFTGVGQTHGALLFQAPFNNTQVAAQMTLYSTDSSGVRGLTIDTDLVNVDGAAIKTGESWGSPVYNTNWGTSTTFNGITGLQGLRYRKDAEDNVWIQGAFKAGATLPGSAVFQLPGGYRPTTQQMIPLIRNNGGTQTSGMALISTSGNVNLFAALGAGIAVGNEYEVNGKVALGNIA